MSDVKPMSLSTAIRLGAMALPATDRGESTVFRYDEDDKPCAACALGSAAFVVGIRFGVMEATCSQNPSGPMVQRWPILAQRVGPPITTYLDRNLAFWISALFEVSGWTREAIAEWVATIEAQQASDPVASPVGDLIPA